MAQHDYVIDNSTGANVRADINSALLAISSNNSGSSAPSTTYALQSFADTTNDMLKLRNEANNAFVNLRKFDGSLPLPDGSDSSPSLFFDDDTNTGIYSSAADTLNITTGGSTAVTVDSSQRVGIGTTSPDAPLTIHNNSDSEIRFGYNSSQDHRILWDSSKVFLEADPENGNANSGIGFKVDGTTRLFIGSDGQLTHTYDIGSNGDAGLVLNTDDALKASSILFQANTENRAKIEVQRLAGDGGQLKIQVADMNNQNNLLDAITIAPSGSTDTTPNVTLTGSLQVGTTDVNGMIHARVDAASSTNFADSNAHVVATGNQYIHISNSNTGGSEQAGFVMNASGSASAIGMIYVEKTNSYVGSMIFRMRTNATTSAVRMTIDSSGNIGAPSGTNIYNASDIRLKKNVADLDKGLSAIKSLRPVSFNWIDGFCDKEKNTLYGFIAQEVENVDGNLIQQFGNGSVTIEGETINDTLRVNEKFIIPMLVKAIQELEAKVAALEAA